MRKKWKGIGCCGPVAVVRDAELYRLEKKELRIAREEVESKRRWLDEAIKRLLPNIPPLTVNDIELTIDNSRDWMVGRFNIGMTRDVLDLLSMEAVPIRIVEHLLCGLQGELLKPNQLPKTFLEFRRNYFKRR